MKPTVEFIGTFFLVFTVALSAVLGLAGPYAPFAIATVLAVMIYAGGHISGAHFNPAVSAGLASRKKLEGRDIGVYIGAQVAGAAAAAALCLTVFRGSTEISPLQPNLVPALVSEFIFTFALVWTVNNVATAKANANNSFYGLAIGGSVLAGAFTVGSVSGGAFNPAVAVGLGVLGKLSWANVAAYAVVEVAAGVVASQAFKALSSDDAG